MQNYSTILGVLDMREKSFSYRDCRARYNIGQGTVKLIIDRFQELGLSLSDLKQMEPDKVENSFYPPENIRRSEVPLPDYQVIYDRLMKRGSKLNLFYLWVEYKKEYPNGYQYTQYVHYFHEFMQKNYGDKKLSMPVERVPGEKSISTGSVINRNSYEIWKPEHFKRSMSLLLLLVSVTVFMQKSF